MTLISDQRIAVLADHGVNQSELTVTRELMEKAGVKMEILSNQPLEVKGWEGTDWGIRIRIDKQVNAVTPEDYDGIIIPGGVFHADTLRSIGDVQNFVKQMFSAGKIVASIGHGIQVMISSDILRGLKVTTPPSLKTDLLFCGAIPVNDDIVADNGIITGKSEKNLNQFTTVFLDTLRKGIKQRTASII